MNYVQKRLKVPDHFPWLAIDHQITWPKFWPNLMPGGIINWGKFESGAPGLPQIVEKSISQFGAVDLAPDWSWGKIEVGAQHYDMWDSKKKQLTRAGTHDVILKRLENVENAHQSWLEEVCNLKNFLSINNRRF